MSRAVVLLSGGLDSTVNLYQAVRHYDVVCALTFDYGQRAAQREKQAAEKFCQKLNVPHRSISLEWMKELGKSSLTNHKENVPMGEEVSIDDLSISQKTAKSVWVPNRNGVLLNIAAAVAESLNASVVVPGFNREEATTFPDNSTDFMNALDHCFSFSTANHVEVKCFTAELNKTEIVRLGRELEVEFSWLWPCYFDGAELCGRCESCQRYYRALRET